MGGIRRGPLVATGVGLFVALPAVVAYNVAQKRIAAIESDTLALSKLLTAALRMPGENASADSASQDNVSASSVEGAGRHDGFGARWARCRLHRRGRAVAMAQLQGRGRAPIVGINVTPMVDVVLVLLVIMMVSATYIVAQSLKVELPKTATSDESVPQIAKVTLTREQKTLSSTNKRSPRRSSSRSCVPRTPPTPTPASC